LLEYNIRDIEAESELSQLIPDLMPSELEFWQADQEINHRGVAMVLEAIHGGIKILEQAHSKYNAELRLHTWHVVESASKVQQLIKWLHAQGVHTDVLDAEAVSSLLKRTDLSPSVRRVLQIREQLASAAVKKLYSMSNRVTRSGRIHDLFLYHSARTGRAAGVGVQPQNLPNSGMVVTKCDKCTKHYVARSCPWCGHSGGVVGEWNPVAADQAIEVMKTGSLPMMEYYFGNALEAMSGCLRGMFIAEKGKRLIGSDYSAIEAVALAELAGEQWRRDVFKTHGMIYEMSASKISGIPFEVFVQHKKDMGSHHPLRKTVGKVAELACFSPDTKVLTQRGYVDIVAVLKTDLLWDGISWVKHSGLVNKGQREVINVDGVKMTPQHPININGSWTEAKQLVSNENILIQALATGSANLPIWVKKDDLLKVTVWQTCSIKEKLSKCKKESTNLSTVYDIVNAGPHNRFTIKTNSGHLLVHNSGYQGWIGAWMQFGADAFMSEQEIKDAILKWRAASPAIVEFWGGQQRHWNTEYYGLEGMAVLAVMNPGQEFEYRGIKFKKHGDTLYCKLLSGRYLTYHRPRLNESQRRAGTFSLSYEGMNTNVKYGSPGWQRLDTYGGKLCENVVQATARDILAYAIVQLEKAGYPVVLHVHDEIVSEVPEDFGSLEEFERIMSTMPEWAKDWPLKAKGGWVANRYCK
jgi:DNA polymerase elongation subunit (family B)